MTPASEASVGEKVEVRRSPLHGRGLFAVARIARGVFIGTFEGRRTQRDGTHVLWIEDDAGRSVGIRGENDLRFLNHAERPNAEFSGPDLHALRAIPAGREICIHYGEDWGEDRAEDREGA
jgi:SET domain-containing protein